MQQEPVDTLIDSALQVTPRQIFLPPEEQYAADYDTALPIGYNQTNSQPLTVKRMLQWLTTKPGERVLDVGCGSGWTTALLAHIVGKKGHVTAVEIIPELLDRARANCQSLGRTNINYRLARHGTLGWPDDAPYDRILVSASATRLPKELVEQLSARGRMVIPVKEEIWVVNARASDPLDIQRYGYYVFVPLIEG